MYSNQLEKLEGYEEQKESYKIVDINKYEDQKLLEDELIVTKVMLLEKSKSIKELVENTRKIFESIDDEKINKMVKIINPLLGDKIGEDETKKLLDSILDKGEVCMLDVLDRIEENEKKKLEKSKKEGIKEGIKEGRKEGKKENTIEITKNMIREGCNIELICSVTGLKRSKVEELLN